MGGRGSGSWYRWSKKTYTDDCRNLDVNRMVKQGAISDSGWKAGNWVWTDTATGERKSWLNYEADTRDPDNAFLRLHYTITDSGEAKDYKIRLERTRAHFNGWRWWFVCPYGHGRTTKLYLRNGGDKYASRHAYRLTYASQGEGRDDRAIRKAWKYRNKIGGQHWPRRPKGMQQKTFERILNQAFQMDEIIDRCFVERFGHYAEELLNR